MNCKMWALLILGVVIAYGAYEYVRVSKLFSVSRTLAQEAVRFEKRAGEHAQHILVAGDSTAVGVGSEPEFSVAGRLSESFDAFVENVSKSGAKTGDVVDQLAHATRGSYDLVVIHTGANDVMYFTNLDEVSTNLSFVLERAHKLSDRVVVLTAGNIGEAPFWPRPLGWFMTSQTKKVRTLVQSQVEESGGVYIDLFALPDPFAEDPERYYAPDFLHLTGDGYGVWADHITDAIESRWPELYADR